MTDVELMKNPFEIGELRVWRDEGGCINLSAAMNETIVHTFRLGRRGNAAKLGQAMIDMSRGEGPDCRPFLPVVPRVRGSV